jgi:hypothetical protein
MIWEGSGKKIDIKFWQKNAKEIGRLAKLGG